MAETAILQVSLNRIVYQYLSRSTEVVYCSLTEGKEFCRPWSNINRPIRLDKFPPFDSCTVTCIRTSKASTALIRQRIRCCCAYTLIPPCYTAPTRCHSASMSVEKVPAGSIAFTKRTTGGCLIPLIDHGVSSCLPRHRTKYRRKRGGSANEALQLRAPIGPRALRSEGQNCLAKVVR